VRPLTAWTLPPVSPFANAPGNSAFAPDQHMTVGYGIPQLCCLEHDFWRERMSDFDLLPKLIRFIALIPALTLHEFAHAWTATRAGDPTPAAHGRVTLNPLPHLDLIGTLMILFGPIGWAKPVPINPANFRHPSRDIIRTSAAGPLSNLAQGIFWGLALRVVLAVWPGLLFERSLAVELLVMMTLINFILMLFNLIPLGPLDGHHILEYKLPYEAARKYTLFNRQYGMAVLIGLMLLSFGTPVRILEWVIIDPAYFLLSLVTGLRF